MGVGSAQAQIGTQAVVTTDRVVATVMAERPALAPGDSIWLGLRLQMAEGWHSYWRNPGDSGLPTMIDWSLPEGLAAGPIQWPAPERQPYSSLMNFGYSDDVVVFLNGRPVYTGLNGFGRRDAFSLGILSDQHDAVYLPLTEGDNELVFALSELFGGWGVMASWAEN